MAEEPSGGYVLRGNDGSLYLIRDEVLQACKMDGKDLEYAERQAQAVKGPGEGPLSDFIRVDYKTAPRWDDAADSAQTMLPRDTIMCGW